MPPQQGSTPKFVRPARPEDAPYVARLQAANTRELLSAALPPADWTEIVSTARLQEAWQETLAGPASAERGTLVAEDNGQPTGFAAYQAAPFPDAVAAPAEEQRGSAVEILALEVSAPHRAAGHASRLLSAISDTARDAGKAHLLVWVVPEDTPRSRFFQSAGFAPMGLRRDLHTPAGPLTQHLWFANLE